MAAPDIDAIANTAAKNTALTVGDLKEMLTAYGAHDALPVVLAVEATDGSMRNLGGMARCGTGIMQGRDVFVVLTRAKHTCVDGG